MNVVRKVSSGRRSPAAADPDLCEGCEQCLQDCPFDAIEMVAGKHPEKHPLRALVLAVDFVVQRTY